MQAWLDSAARSQLDTPAVVVDLDHGAWVAPAAVS